MQRELMAIPSQAFAFAKEGVETRRAATNAVQTVMLKG